MVCTPERRERKRPFDVRFRRERRMQPSAFRSPEDPVPDLAVEQVLHPRCRRILAGLLSTICKHEGLPAPSDTPSEQRFRCAGWI
jgi:hypothetical protein